MFWAFLEFCYLVRRDVITDKTLVALQDALSRFHQYREIFRTTGVHPDRFSLPHQHLLVHYEALIRLFGTPNGLCTSITESKHIKAVKEPWRCSNGYEALGQMLPTNQRLDKLAAAAIDFEKCGMLEDSLTSSHSQYLGIVYFHFHLSLYHHWTDSTSQAIVAWISLSYNKKLVQKIAITMTTTMAMAMAMAMMAMATMATTMASLIRD